MDFRINGRAVTVDVDLRTSLLDLLREHLHLTGTKKGCNQGACGACTVLVDGERINCLPGAGRAVPGPRDHDDRGAWPTARRCTRCSRRSSSMTASSAATARPARSARRSAWWPSCERGVPSAVTDDLAAAAHRRSPDDELRERMSGNLCRCGAYNGIVDAIHASVRTLEAASMNAVQLRPRRRRRRGGAPGGRSAERQVPRRRHQPRRPDARDDRAARRADRRDRPRRAASRSGRDGGLRHRRCGQEHRARRRPRGARALSRCLPAPSSPARRRRSATWPRSAATCCSARAATTSTTTPRAATSARPAPGCDALDGFNRIHAILGASTACVATHPSDMCVALAALDAVVHIARRARRAHACRFVDFHRLPGDTPDIETVLEPGELITAVELPPLRFARPLDLSQGARPGELRLRAGLGRRRARVATTARVARRAAGARRRGAQAVAGAKGRGCAARRQPPTRRISGAAAEAELAARAAAQRQRLQDRARQAHDRRHVLSELSRGEHAHEPSAEPPRRAPCCPTLVPGTGSRSADRRAARSVGQPVSRVDGPLKVSGAARFAAEVPLENLALCRACLQHHRARPHRRRSTSPRPRRRPASCW